MSIAIGFEPRRFASAAKYYREGRPAYSQQLIRRVASILRLNERHRLLDLGTGPGLLAVAFAPSVASVTAIDPEPEMLHLAAEHAAEAGVTLDLREGSSFTLDDNLGRYKLVTIGRAFHWMDRARTLDQLDRLVEPDGAVAFFATRHPNVAENAWLDDYNALLETYGEAGSHRAVRRSPDWIPHESILLDSVFSRLERITVIERRMTPIEQFAVRAFSLSSNSPGRIGPRAEELARAIPARLAKYASAGAIPELVESEALLAFRKLT